VVLAAYDRLFGLEFEHLDAGYDYQTCRQVLAERGMAAQIAARGVPAPIQVGRRWVIERTHAWGNQYGKLRWCTERRRLVVEFWLALTNAVIVLGRLLRRAWVGYRWEGRPPSSPITAYWRSPWSLALLGAHLTRRDLPGRPRPLQRGDTSANQVGVSRGRIQPRHRRAVGRPWSGQCLATGKVTAYWVGSRASVPPNWKV
jgi:hypothetical protein